MRKFTCVALLAAGLLCGCPDKSSNPGAPSTPPAGGDTSTSQPSGGKTETPPADSGKKTEAENFWKDMGVGSVVEYKMVTDMTKPAAMKTEMVQKKTLKSKDDKGYVLSVEMTTAGTTMPATEEKGEWAVATGGDASATSSTKAKDMGNEKVTVGDQSLDCKHWQVESDMAGVKTTTDSWTCKNYPVKSVTKNENMTSTMEMTKIEKK